MMATAETVPECRLGLCDEQWPQPHHPPPPSRPLLLHAPSLRYLPIHIANAPTILSLSSPTLKPRRQAEVRCFVVVTPAAVSSTSLCRHRHGRIRCTRHNMTQRIRSCAAQCRLLEKAIVSSDAREKPCLIGSIKQKHAPHSCTSIRSSPRFY